MRWAMTHELSVSLGLLLLSQLIQKLPNISVIPLVIMIGLGRPVFVPAFENQICPL